MYPRIVLLDLSTLPPTLSVNECPGHLVVRTRASKGANGILCRTQDSESAHKGRTYFRELKPGAQLPQPDGTYLETLVPSPGLPRNALIFEGPWEVATVAKDIVTDVMRVWRATVQVQQHPKNEALWLVGVGRCGDPQYLTKTHVLLLRVATKDLFISPRPVQFPLRRYIQDAAMADDAPVTVWDRLTSEDE